MNALKSHSREEILAAVRENKPLCLLDSGNHGDDDVLIGSYEDCRDAVLYYFEWEEMHEDYDLDIMSEVDVAALVASLIEDEDECEDCLLARALAQED